MKKILYLLLFSGLLSLFSCKRTDPFPCNNSKGGVNIALDWTGTNYNVCGGGFAGNSQPPNSSYNYLHENSVTGAPAKLTAATDFLCMVVSNNDEQAKDGCDGPASDTAYWKAGSLQRVSEYTKYATDFVVDYYDVCNLCSAVGKNARPHFIGMTTLPGGLPTITIKPYTQAPLYTNSNCQ